MSFTPSIQNRVSIVNSSNAPLASDAAFTGVFENMSSFAQIDVSSLSDVDGTLYLDTSNDGVTVLNTTTFTTSSGKTSFRAPFNFQYYRLRYINNSVAQTTFTLQALLRATDAGIAALTATRTMSQNTLTPITRTVLVSENQSGSFNNVSYGQQPMADSLPVVIASDQTPIPVSISSDVVVGEVKLIDSGGTNIASVSASGALSVDGSSVTQPVSISSVPLPVGAATEATQLSVKSDLDTIAAALTNPLPVSDSTTQTILSAIEANQTNGAQRTVIVAPVSVSNFPGTQPVSGSVSVSNLPETQVVSGTVTANAGTNLNTSSLALESGGNIAAIKADTDKIPNQGSAVIAHSTPVNIASDQVVPVSASSLPLPTGGSTSALQTSGNASLSSIASALTNPLPVSAASLPLPTGAATSTLQTTGNTSLSTIATNIPAQGSAVTAHSLPVNIASDQTVPISAASLPLPTGAATAANQASILTGLTTISSNQTNGTQVTTGPSIIKGTQGSSGFTVQNIKDAGRNVTNYFMAVPVITTSSDALQSLTGYKSGAAVAATTTPVVVTTGKTYRIVSIVLNYVAVSTAGTAKFTLRANTSGVVAIGSPAVISHVIGGGAATAGISQTVSIPIPDGMEFAAGTGIGVSMFGQGATQAAAAVGYGQISIYGYEY